MAVLNKYAAALHVVERITLSNDGSILDERTFPPSLLDELVKGLQALPALRRISLETRPEFITMAWLDRLRESSVKAVLDFLVGLETVDDRLRQVVLGKSVARTSFENALDMLASYPNVAVTSYILVKPAREMTDQDALDEACATIDYLHKQTLARGLPLSIRLNPMYVAPGTLWGADATERGYVAPRLSDVLAAARHAEKLKVPSYIGLSSEGIPGEHATYRDREDFNKTLLKEAIAWNRSQRG
mgnify:CR=1 FL=1